MELTEIKNEQKLLKARLKSLEVAEKKARERSDPNRRLTKTEVEKIKIMLQAGEEVKIIAKKSSTNIEVVRYWQGELNISEEKPYQLKDIKELKSKPSYVFSDTEKALKIQKRNHDPNYSHYTLKEKGKQRHDLLKKCPACFPESTMLLSEYNEFVRAGNFESVRYMRKKESIEKESHPNKTLVSSDKAEWRETFANRTDDLEIQDAIVPMQKRNGKNTKRERKLIKQMNNVPPEIIINFCRSKGISIT
tara:strand:- start:8604 stop:9350 length:747 start_codon:yes stop_codon:yes gene_type:complete